MHMYIHYIDMQTDTYLKICTLHTYVAYENIR